MSNLPKRILGVYAHPDDECYCAGGTMAYYASLGAECKVISATRGEAGEIHDAHAASRKTLGEVREQELIGACHALGVQQVQCFDYLDGHLADADHTHVVGDVVAAIREFQPDVVITFGDDGAYGHPDHVAISRATTDAFYLASQADAYPDTAHPAFAPQKLYYAHFPERNYLMLEEISKWLVGYKNRFRGNTEFAHALSLFVRESVMLNYSKDFVEVRWYPPNFAILEQGEPSKELFVIMSGLVLVREHHEDDEQSQTLVNMGEGDFFGEIGIVTGQPRSADIVTIKSTTCLVFSPYERANYTGRGTDAVLGDIPPEKSIAQTINSGEATHQIDVTDFVVQKTAAIGQHRTQTPISHDMFPKPMLDRLLGIEFFVQVYPPLTLETEL